MTGTTTVKVLGMCAVVGLSLAGRTLAQEEAVSAEAAAGVDVASAYIFRGGTISDEVSVQPALEGAFGNLTLGTWANFNTDAEQFDEVDYYFSYALPLGDFPIGFSIGYTEYTYPAASHEHPGGLAPGEVSPALEADREINIGASYETALNDKLTFSTGLGVNIGLEGPFLDDGLYVAAEAGLSQSVSDDLSLDFGAVLGSELGDNYEENGLSHATLTAGASYKFLAASVSYVVETDDEVLEVDEDVVGVLSLSLPL